MELVIIVVTAIVTLIIVNVFIAYRYTKKHEEQGHEARFNEVILAASDVRFRVSELEQHLKGCAK